MVGNSHVGVFKIINELQKEQNQVQVAIESILRGELRPLSRRKDHERETRIQTIYNDRNNRTLMDFLKGFAHNLTF